MLITAAGGLAVDSITMIIDSAASLIMVGTGFLMFFAVSKIHRPPDEFFNFGYDKYEPFTVVGQGFLIIATCVIGVKFAIQDLIHPEEIKNFYIPVIATAVTGLIGFCIFLYVRRESEETGSNLLKMASVHWRADCSMALGLFLGFLLGLVLTSMGKTSFTRYIDPVMTILLAGYLLREPLEAVIKSSRELLDAVPDGKIREKIKSIVDEHSPGSLGSHRVRTRKAGERVFVDVRFDVDPAMTAENLAEISSRFEKEMEKHLPSCDVVVFFKPSREKTTLNAA
jgi:cation diffusion facilitator family transporter